MTSFPFTCNGPPSCYWGGDEHRPIDNNAQVSVTYHDTFYHATDDLAELMPGNGLSAPVQIILLDVALLLPG